MQYTLAVTSCSRHDLLEKTLRSFCDCIQQQPTECVILEDGPAPAPPWLKELPKLGKIRWINNEGRMGQSYSISRLYSEITTEYIFWLEDDFLFHEANFLQPSFQILSQHKDISMVALRSDWNHPTQQDPRGFLIAEPYWGGVWGGTCHNPGLRRLSDYKRFGSYSRHCGFGTNGLGHEQIWSKLHLDAGFRIAVLPSHCYHIGGGRSRAIEQLEYKLPKILIAIPACHKFDYGRWESEESPHYNPATAWEGRPYGTDIHISGPNPRIAAVRETWFRDVATFASHMDAKFFYGVPHNREPLEDEVFLSCPDDYGSLPLKTQAICKWALEHDYQYVLKADDDTIVYVDRLVKELLDNPHMEYGGYMHANICTGGCGYWLGRRAMRQVVNFGQMEHWAEDVSVGIALERSNISGTFLAEHRPGFKAHWYFDKGFDPAKLDQNIVTAHAVGPETMREWYKHKENKCR